MGASGDLDLWDVFQPKNDAPAHVHSTAVVAKGAELDHGVEIGPYAIIGPHVRLARGVRVGAHAVIENRTTIGHASVVYPFASLGSIPQDLKYKGEDCELIVGAENSIRQYVNMSIGTAGGGGKTVVGRRNIFMVNCHVAHDCQVGDNIVFANGVSLAGHVHVDHHALLGGHAAVHQFCRIGGGTMVGGGSMVVQDVPPWVMVQGDRAKPIGLNVVGLRRAGISAESIRDLKTMYRLLYSENLTVDDAISRMEGEVPAHEYRTAFVAFLRQSERGVCR